MAWTLFSRMVGRQEAVPPGGRAAPQRGYRGPAAQTKRDRRTDGFGLIAPRTISNEVSILRTFFNFLINERKVQFENPCARFKPLRDPKEIARRRPPVYSQAELDRLFYVCTEYERAIFTAGLAMQLTAPFSAHSAASVDSAAEWR